MGAPKGGGYIKQSTMNEGQENILDLLSKLTGMDLSSGGNLAENPLYKQSVEATKQFLPGGQGFAPIQAEAQRAFQQQTIPSILNAFGSGSKSSSALNQALAGAGQNLNTSLASMLSQMQLQAANQGAHLAAQPYQQGLQGAQLALGTTPFAYQQRATPFWQDLTLQGIKTAGDIAGAKFGK